MKRVISNLVFGRGNALSGLIAFGVVALIALGCTCGKDLDLSNLGKDNSNSSHTSSNTSSSNTFGGPSNSSKTSTSKADASKAEMPADDELQAMIKETLLDFDSAVQKADFSDFYSHIAKEWQKQTSPESMKTTFQGFIDKNISIKDIGSLDAEFSPTPSIGREVGFKTLMVEGKYPTTPRSTKFELNYIANGKDWKLSKIVVDTTETNY
jgi:hypothetical protein